VSGAPPVGTTWVLPRNEETAFTVELPTYRAESGLDAYQLALTFGPVHEPGDMDGNGLVDFADVGPFVLALNDPAAYANRFGLAPADRGDLDTDGDLDFDDISAFAALLAVPGTRAVPEPSSWVLLVAAAVILVVGRSRPTPWWRCSGVVSEPPCGV